MSSAVSSVVPAVVTGVFESLLHSNAVKYLEYRLQMFAISGEKAGFDKLMALASELDTWFTNELKKLNANTLTASAAPADPTASGDGTDPSTAAPADPSTPAPVDPTAIPSSDGTPDAGTDPSAAPADPTTTDTAPTDPNASGDGTDPSTAAPTDPTAATPADPSSSQ